MAASVLFGTTICKPRHAALDRSRAQQPYCARSLAAVCHSTAVEFTKYQGLGNDFILVSCRGINRKVVTHESTSSFAPQVDNRHQEELLVSAEAAVKLCDRNFGIGGDGVRTHDVQLLIASNPASQVEQAIAAVGYLCTASKG